MTAGRPRCAISSATSSSTSSLVPSRRPSILDAIVAYIEDIDFLPNLSLDANGRLTSQANDAERRGEAIFFRPFPHDPSLSCATCHIPSADSSITSSTMSAPEGCSRRRPF